MNISLQNSFSAFRIVFSSIGQPVLGSPSGQVAFGRLKSPPKIMFGTGSKAERTDFALLSGIMTSLAVDGFPLVLSSGCL